MSEVEAVPTDMRIVQSKSTRAPKKNLYQQIKKVTTCPLGEKRCRACKKNMDHKSPPKYITCLYCNSIHNFFRLRTGNIRRERIYLEDSNGERIMRRDNEGNSLGFAWAPGDKMYYEDQTPVPETKFATCCGSDCCKFYKIPINEVQKYADHYKDLERV
jgi:hypothetical protein